MRIWIAAFEGAMISKYRKPDKPACAQSGYMCRTPSIDAFAAKLVEAVKKLKVAVTAQWPRGDYAR